MDKSVKKEVIYDGPNTIYSCYCSFLLCLVDVVVHNAATVTEIAAVASAAPAASTVAAVTTASTNAPAQCAELRDLGPEIYFIFDILAHLSHKASFKRLTIFAKEIVYAAIP